MAIKLTKEVKISHHGGVVHRDLKPTNIMVDAKKEFALVDFGIGNVSDRLRGSCGTPGFNAPEQFSGERQEFPVDIFSLGKNLILILFEWKIGWNLLWSSEEWLRSQNLEHKLAALSYLFQIFRSMTHVSTCTCILIYRVFFVHFQYSFRNLQIDSYKRPKVDDVLNVLKATEACISTDPKIEADWKSFHYLIKVPAEFKVDERTQCSRDLFKELTQLSLKAKSGEMVTGGTKLHYQMDTNLCAYFATMSALRHQLKELVVNEKSQYSSLDVEEYLKQFDKDEKRFERDLAVMIGCICPRALSAWFKIKQSLFLFFISK